MWVIRQHYGGGHVPERVQFRLRDGLGVVLFDHLNGVAHIPRRFLVTFLQRPEERGESVAKSIENPFAVVHGSERHTQFPFEIEQVLSETSAQTPEGYRGVWDDWQESD